MKKIAINGFGRIGRATFKILFDNKDVEIVAINDLSENDILAHLLKYDSVYGIYEKEVLATKDGILVDGKEIRIFEEKNPANLPWKELEVDTVLECTGFFRDIEGANKHIEAGAKKVIISAPAKSEEIPSYVLGVNFDEYKGEAIIDMGSCTTNCLAPILKVVNNEIGIKNGFMTTIHSYTANQNLLDGAHNDKRRARAAALNTVPTTTGATKAVAKVIPSLKGVLNGLALRVPTPIVSIVDLTLQVDKSIAKEDLNVLFEKYAKNDLKGILNIEKKPLVSSDYIKNSFSSIVDAELTQANQDMIKVLSWYDNEWGYSCRLAETAILI